MVGVRVCVRARGYVRVYVCMYVCMYVCKFVYIFYCDGMRNNITGLSWTNIGLYYI